MDTVVEVTIDRLLEVLYSLKDDDDWIDEILDITEEGDRKQVKATVTHFIRMIEAEF